MSPDGIRKASLVVLILVAGGASWIQWGADILRWVHAPAVPPLSDARSRRVLADAKEYTNAGTPCASELNDALRSLGSGRLGACNSPFDPGCAAQANAIDAVYPHDLTCTPSADFGTLFLIVDLDNAVQLHIDATRRDGRLDEAVEQLANYVRFVELLARTGHHTAASYAVPGVSSQLEVLLGAGADIAPVAAALGAWANQTPDARSLIRAQTRSNLSGFARKRGRRRLRGARTAMYVLEQARASDTACASLTLWQCRHWLVAREQYWDGVRAIATGVAAHRALDRAIETRNQRNAMTAELALRYQLAIVRATAAVRLAQTTGSECGSPDWLAPYLAFDRFGVPSPVATRTETGWVVARPRWASQYRKQRDDVIRCESLPPAPDSERDRARVHD